MVARCNSSANRAYKDYGGRGIYIDKSLSDFTKFRDWALDNGYDKNLTIDRIDNNGPYSVKNCRWTDHKTQCRNRRSNKMIEYNGKIKSLIEWTENLGLKYGITQRRLRDGWSVQKAFNTPIK